VLAPLLDDARVRLGKTYEIELEAPELDLTGEIRIESPGEPEVVRMPGHRARYREKPLNIFRRILEWFNFPQKRERELISAATSDRYLVDGASIAASVAASASSELEKEVERLEAAIDERVLPAVRAYFDKVVDLLAAYEQSIEGARGARAMDISKTTERKQSLDLLLSECRSAKDSLRQKRELVSRLERAS
jgi:hypothetical protein